MLSQYSGFELMRWFKLFTTNLTDIPPETPYMDDELMIWNGISSTFVVFSVKAVTFLRFQMINVGWKSGAF